MPGWRSISTAIIIWPWTSMAGTALFQRIIEQMSNKKAGYGKLHYQVNKEKKKPPWLCRGLKTCRESSNIEPFNPGTGSYETCSVQCIKGIGSSAVPLEGVNGPLQVPRSWLVRISVLFQPDESLRHIPPS